MNIVKGMTIKYTYDKLTGFHGYTSIINEFYHNVLMFCTFNSEIIIK